MKKLLALVLALTCLLSLTSVGAVGAATTQEVYASNFYQGGIWGDPWLMLGGYAVFGKGTVDQGVLSTPTATPTDREYYPDGNYRVTDTMVFTFDEEVTLSSMVFTSISDGEFPTEYQIQYRPAEYYSEAHGFTGNPSEEHIAGGENWPIVEGFGPEEGIFYTEVVRDGDTVAINLDVEIDCVAIMIQAITNGETPWSCKEAHFYDGPYIDTRAYTYEIENGEATITGCDPSICGEVVIPDTLEGCPVTAIGDWAFAKCDDMTSVTVPETVTSIGGWAFANCTDLKKVNLPEGLTALGDNAFMNCTSLASFEIPSGITELSIGLFEGCYGLTSVTIPHSVTHIGYGAFINCISLTDVEIPDSVTVIDHWAFYHCLSLDNITIPASVTEIGGEVFEWCENVTIYGYAGSQAEEYAESCNIPFGSLGTVEQEPLPIPLTLGDVNGDEGINAVDATRVLLLSVGKVTLTREAFAAADVNIDGKVNAADATRILLHTVGKKPIEG